MVDPRLSTNPTLSRAGLPMAYLRDGSGSGVAPVAIRDGSHERPRRMLCDSTTQSATSDWRATDTTKMALPTVRFVMPQLRRAGLYSWDVIGDYENTGPDNTTISAQILVNAVETGSAFAWTQNAAVTTPGVILLTVDLRVIGSPTPRHLLSAELTVINSSGTAVIGPPTSVTRLHQILSLDSLAEHNIGLQVWKSTSVGANPLAIQSIGFYELITTSGS